MWEAFDMKDEKCLWASTAFNGGIARNQNAPCGALSSGVVVLGLHHSCDMKQEEKAKRRRDIIREDADALFKSFLIKYGDTVCIKLLGLDFSIPGEYQRFQQSGIWKDRCHCYVEFVIRKLYELDEKRSTSNT